MPQKFFIVPAGDGHNPVDPSYGIPGGGEIDNSLPSGPPGHPSNPIVLPPLIGIWPPPGTPNWPPVDPGWGVGRPPHIGGGPILIPGTPENPIALPPGIYPPLPPSSGVAGKVAILIWVVGVGYRWLVYDGPVATPK